MSGLLASIYRYPVKGFTPEALERAPLASGRGLPLDRAFSVEDGPSGFDPAAPAFVPKMKFTVLAKIAELALIRTRLDDDTGLFHAAAPNAPPIAADLQTDAGRGALAAWLGKALDGHVRGPLRLLPAPGAHRFFDDPRGHVSLINLESVRDLERKIGRPVDPLRFRANLHVEGWPAWSELEAQGRTLRIGAAEARLFGPIVRCAATHVDPRTGVRDIDMVNELRTHYGHAFCGVYLHVEKSGEARRGDRAEFGA